MNQDHLSDHFGLQVKIVLLTASRILWQLGCNDMSRQNKGSKEKHEYRLGREEVMSLEW
jgi:hypothetical protein